MHSDEQFYDRLPVLESFFKVSKPEHYLPLPGDWYIGVTDIVNSTDAIDKNLYKWVNILGASPIVGLLNETEDQKLPFSFGGDGCVICFPPSLLDSAKNVFAASKKIGKSEFDLDLRAAIIPVQEVRAEGYDVKVARFKVSDVYDQAVFIGGGLNYLENFLKSDPENLYSISLEDGSAEADFSGLECRWKEVGPKNKTVITLLIQSNPEHPKPEKIYDKVLNKMQDIFGFDNKTNPIPASALKMNMSIPKLMGEVRFRTFGKGLVQRILYLLKIQLQILLGKIFMKAGYKSSSTDWKLYKPDLSLNSDHRKFDDMLRLVISGTEKQYREMMEFLESMFTNRELVYGVHTSDTAVITCMVFAYHRQHFHFIDGSNGGYVIAAKDLKQRSEKLNQSSEVTH